MDARASLPAIGRLLADARVGALVVRFGKAIVTSALRDAVAAARRGEVAHAESNVIAAAAAALEVHARGTLVPVINATGGARLVEVGTTKRTRRADYGAALDTVGSNAVLLKVHRSNFAIVGFTEEASLEELVSLAHARSPRPRVVYDLGSGLLLPGRE